MAPSEAQDVTTLRPMVLDRGLIDSPLPPIVRAGDPVLRQPASAVRREDILTPKMQRLVHTMVEVMHRAPGVGLAAPQIGVPLRVIVVEDQTRQAPGADALAAADPRQRDGVPLLALFNPELQRLKGAKKATHHEGCLSVPGYSAEVARDLEIMVSGLDHNGEPLRLIARGWAARIFQHECDHLKGTLYVDKMNPRSLTADGR